MRRNPASAGSHSRGANNRTPPHNTSRIVSLVPLSNLSSFRNPRKVELARLSRPKVNHDTPAHRPDVSRKCLPQPWALSHQFTGPPISAHLNTLRFVLRRHYRAHPCTHVVLTVRCLLFSSPTHPLLPQRSSPPPISPQSTQDMPIQDSLFIITKQSKQFHEPISPQSTQDMPIQDSLFIITKQSKQFHETLQHPRKKAMEL